MNLAVAVLFVRCQKITESQLPQDAIDVKRSQSLNCPKMPLRRCQLPQGSLKTPSDNFELILKLIVISTVIVLFDFSIKRCIILVML